ncbi:hypothetical protein SFPB_122 [Shigella phage SFPB]|uniref:Uncharacterized protein n=1 Tax=Shigella phage SFPB TaxID=3017292 RepID=A0AAE9W347_9CAUD|nr:hypothetical protein SFPB_122 [Shigella phage SFPB]
MFRLIVEKHPEDDKLETGRFGDTFFIRVGWKADPLEVKKIVYNFAGLELKQVIFETMLPENKDTCNNAYILTRVR